MAQQEILLHAIRRILSLESQITRPEVNIFGDLVRTIGHTPVNALVLRINRETVPPTLFFGFIWNEEANEEELIKTPRNVLRRSLHAVRTGLKAYKIDNRPTFAANSTELNDIVARRNNPIEKDSLIELSGTIERVIRNKISVQIRHD